MIRDIEGPTYQEYAPPDTKVCNACKWCKVNNVFEVNFAMCTHIYSEDYLDHDAKSVFTPEWCPVDKPQERKVKQEIIDEAKFTMACLNLIKEMGSFAYCELSEEQIKERIVKYL